MAQQVKKLEGAPVSSSGTETKKPIEVFRDVLNSQKKQLEKVLPSHVPFERFQSVVMTAVLTNPDLLKANRHSLLISCIKAATDGLTPDGRDAALVTFNTKDKDESGKDVWVKKVQYMPMYAGILKKVRQSGELASVVTHIVYEKDKFEYLLGDEDRISHEPYLGREERGGIVAAYCIAKLKDGSVIREVMAFQDIEKVRKSSKAGNDDQGNPKGIWKNWYEEMARKTVFRRTAKWLPQSVEIAGRIFENDDSMQTFGQVDEAENLVIEQENDMVAIEDQSGGQPDLAAEIEKANAKEKVPASTPEKATKPTKAQTVKPPAAQPETPSEKEVPLSDFDRIKNDMSSSPDIESLNAVWCGGEAGPYEDELCAMGPGEWNKLRALHDELLAKMAGG